MAKGNTQPIAPVSVLLPKALEQNVSGALFISGAGLYFFPYDGSNKLHIVTSAAI